MYLRFVWVLINLCTNRGNIFLVQCREGGSGSTLIACEKTARVSLVMELDPKYCDVIIKRWQAFTGKKAILERTGEEFDTLCASISEETVIK